MKITIVRIDNKTKTLTVEPTDTIGKVLKKFLNEGGAQGLNANTGVFLYKEGAPPLAENKTLAFYDIQEGDTLNLKSM